MKLSYRILQGHDVAAYRHIRLEALLNFSANFGSTYQAEKAKPKLAFETYIEQQTPGKFIVGAFDNDVLIGICGFAAEEGERSRHRGTVIQMYVQAQYSGKSVGLQLLQAVIQAAFNLPGIEQLVLGVITTNISAVKVYEKAGFTTFGVQHNYFKEDDGSYLHQQFMALYKNGYV